MIKLTVAQVRDPEFTQAFNRLLSVRMGIKTARVLQKIATALQAEQTEADKLFSVLQTNYLEPMGDQGMFRIKESLSEEDKLTAKKEIDEFLQSPVEVNQPAIREADIPLAEFTPLDLIKLGPIFSEE